MHDPRLTHTPGAFELRYDAQERPYLLLADGRRLAIPGGGAPDPAPASGDATGGAATGTAATAGRTAPNGDAGPAEPLIPQTQLNRILADHKRGLQADLATSKTQLDAAQKKLEEQGAELQSIKEFLQGLGGEPEPDDDTDPELTAAARVLEIPDNLAKQPELAELWRKVSTGRHSAKQKIAALEAKIAEMTAGLTKIQDETKAERERRQAAEQRFLDTRKHNRVLSLLTQLKAIDPEYHVDRFASRLVLQEGKDPDARDAFAYRTANGELVDPLEGMKSELPDWAIESAIGGGGSGSHGGRGGPAPGEPQDELKRLETELVALEARQKQTSGQPPSQADITRSLALERRIRQLKQSAGTK